MAKLTHDEIKIYSRHLTLPEVGIAGQEKLKASSVLLVGAGGLGSPSSMYLAAAGVGRLGIIDNDIVDPSNLHRQILHGHSTLGIKKVNSGERRLKDINPYIAVDAYDIRITANNALEIFKDYDVIVDGTDNFPTRYLVNDACALLKKPYVFASIFRFDGQITVFDSKKGPCYRCIYPKPPLLGTVPSCSEGGVLGILPGIVGTIQAAEAIKLILDAGNSLLGRLLMIDVLSMTFDEIKITKDPQCMICSENPKITKLIDEQQLCEMPSSIYEWEIMPSQLRDILDEKTIIVDVRTPSEWEIAKIEGAVLIPLQDLRSRLSELPKERQIVTYCKSGSRSMSALSLLKQSGYQNIKSLKGGILAWSRDIDPSIPQY